MSNVRYFHLYDQVTRNLCTDRVMTIATKVVEKNGVPFVYYGVSVCKPTVISAPNYSKRELRTGGYIFRKEGDQYNRKFGNDLALARLEKCERRDNSEGTTDKSGSETSGLLVVLVGHTPLETVVRFLEATWTDGHIKRMLSYKADELMMLKKARQELKRAEQAL